MNDDSNNRDDRRPRREGDGDRAKKPYGDRGSSSGGKQYGDRGASSDRRPSGDRDRKPYGDRGASSERKPYGDRNASSDRKPYGDRGASSDRRPTGDRDRKPYGDRSASSDRKPYGDRSGSSDRRPSGDRDRRPFGDRDRRDDRSSTPFREGARPGREEHGLRGEGSGESFKQFREEIEPPHVPDDVEANELDKAARTQLKTLAKDNAEQVAKHLVMAARLIDENPALAHEHALAASRTAGRIGVVRETVAITAYQLGEFALALRELRTYRRITGNDDQLPLMVDCERGLGRPEKALELARTVTASDLPTQVRVELAIVKSGARLDLGQKEAALDELRIPELVRDKAFDYSPALFASYANVLEELGRDDEAEEWFELSDRAVDALEVAYGAGETETVDVTEERIIVADDEDESEGAAFLEDDEVAELSESVDETAAADAEAIEAQRAADTELVADEDDADVESIADVEADVSAAEAAPSAAAEPVETTAEEAAPADAESDAEVEPEVEPVADPASDVEPVGGADSDDAVLPLFDLDEDSKA